MKLQAGKAEYQSSLHSSENERKKKMNQLSERFLSFSQISLEIARKWS